MSASTPRRMAHDFDSASPSLTAAQTAMLFPNAPATNQPAETVSGMTAVAAPSMFMTPTQTVASPTGTSVNGLPDADWFGLQGQVPVHRQVILEATRAFLILVRLTVTCVETLVALILKGAAWGFAQWHQQRAAVSLDPNSLFHQSDELRASVLALKQAGQSVASVQEIASVAPTNTPAPSPAVGLKDKPLPTGRRQALDDLFATPSNETPPVKPPQAIPLAASAVTFADVPVEPSPEEDFLSFSTIPRPAMPLLQPQPVAAVQQESPSEPVVSLTAQLFADEPILDPTDLNRQEVERLQSIEDMSRWLEQQEQRKAIRERVMSRQEAPSTPSHPVASASTPDPVPSASLLLMIERLEAIL